MSWDPFILCDPQFPKSPKFIQTPHNGSLALILQLSATHKFKAMTDRPGETFTPTPADEAKILEMCDIIRKGTAALRKSRIERRKAADALFRSTSELKENLNSLVDLDRAVSALEALRGMESP